MALPARKLNEDDQPRRPNLYVVGGEPNQTADDGDNLPNNVIGFAAKKQQKEVKEAEQTEQAEAEKLAAVDGGFYNPKGKSPAKIKSKGWKGWIRRRRNWVIASIVSVVLGAYGFSILSGPFQIIHMAQLLTQFHMGSNEGLSASRVAKAIKYIRTADHPEKRRLGRLGNFAADKIEARIQKELGIKTIYENSRFKGYEVIDIEKARSKLDFDELERNGLKPATDTDGKLKIKIAGNLKVSERPERAAIRFITRVAFGSTKIGAAMQARPLIKRAGVTMHPFGRLSRKQGEGRSAWLKEVREFYNQENKNGAKGERVGATEHIDPDNPDQGPPSEDVERAIADANALNAEGSAKVDPKARIKSIRAKLLGGTILGIGLVCILKALVDVADELGDH